MQKRKIVGRVAELRRYPVKSMLGERLQSARVDVDGVAGDRAYAVLDVADDTILSAKRLPELLEFHARTASNGMVGIEFPDGFLAVPGTEELDRRLSRVLRREVRVIPRPDGGTRRIKMGASADTTEGESSFETSHGFFDSAPLHLLTTSSLEAARRLHPTGTWDARRFRPNLLVETPEETGFVWEGWRRRTLGIGAGLRVDLLRRCSRCVMTTHAQEELPADRDILRTIATQNQNFLGMLGAIVEAGEVAIGDEVWLDA